MLWLFVSYLTISVPAVGILQFQLVIGLPCGALTGDYKPVAC